jgi:hypothetical protein
VQNRVYKGKEYERWLVTIPPELVKEMGWDETTELKAKPGKKGLTLVPYLAVSDGDTSLSNPSDSPKGARRKGIS